MQIRKFVDKGRPSPRSPRPPHLKGNRNSFQSGYCLHGWPAPRAWDGDRLRWSRAFWMWCWSAGLDGFFAAAEALGANCACVSLIP